MAVSLEVVLSGEDRRFLFLTLSQVGERKRQRDKANKDGLGMVVAIDRPPCLPYYVGAVSHFIVEQTIGRAH